MMSLDFQCTKCGACCGGFRLPLSVGEALNWLQDGNPVEVLCEAIPWPSEPPPSDLAAAFKRERSFPARSGALPIRVLVTLVAPLGDACPNLASDQSCQIYQRRPRACRIYPAESNPFVEFVPARKRCPTEAWRAGGEPFIRHGAYVQPELRVVVQGKMQQAVDDVPALQALCAALGLRQAAMANEGYVVHAPSAADFLNGLSVAPREPARDLANWEFVSNNSETVEAIQSCNGECLPSSGGLHSQASYLSLFSGTPLGTPASVRAAKPSSGP